MSMAQNMAKEMEAQMDAIEVEGNAGGGMVTVKMNGHKHIRSLAIAQEVVNPDDTEMLQDLIIAAVNDAIARVDEKLKNQMGHLAGGLPGGFPLGGL
jgi:nucleoid-associated protein EbfC